MALTPQLRARLRHFWNNSTPLPVDVAAVRSKAKAYSAGVRNALADSYVRGVMRAKGDVTGELIEAKRMQIRIYRKLKEKQNDIHPGSL